MKIIIPARKGSKGVPFKNRKLLGLTLDTIPEKLLNDTIVSTNDEEIVRIAKERYKDCKIHNRSEISSRDESSMKECATEVVNEFCLKEDTIILYLTYPERTWAQVRSAYSWFKEMSAESLLCRQSVLSHPYLCFYELPDGRGESVVPHNLHRRQDYPKCFHVRHMISIFKPEVLKDLNENLYNNNTVYYEIEKTLDIDTEEDINSLRRRP